MESHPCYSCKYPVEPSPGTSCPECGMMQPAVLRPLFPVELDRSAALLQGADMLIEKQVDLFSGARQILIGTPPQGLLVVKYDRLEEAVSLLEAHGIVLKDHNQLPIVDINDTSCPECEHALSSSRVEGEASRCDGCSYEFIWVDVGTQDEMP